MVNGTVVLDTWPPTQRFLKPDHPPRDALDTFARYFVAWKIPVGPA